MSYCFRVNVTDGELTVEQAPNVPDGDFLVSGHEDDHGRNIGITRYAGERQPHNPAVIQASGFASRV